MGVLTVKRHASLELDHQLIHEAALALARKQNGGSDPEQWRDVTEVFVQRVVRDYQEFVRNHLHRVGDISSETLGSALEYREACLKVPVGAIEKDDGAEERRPSDPNLAVVRAIDHVRGKFCVAYQEVEMHKVFALHFGRGDPDECRQVVASVRELMWSAMTICEEHIRGHFLFQNEDHRSKKRRGVEDALRSTCENRREGIFEAIRAREREIKNINEAMAKEGWHGCWWHGNLRADAKCELPRFRERLFLLSERVNEGAAHIAGLLDPDSDETWPSRQAIIDAFSSTEAEVANIKDLLEPYLQVYGQPNAVQNEKPKA